MDEQTKYPVTFVSAGPGDPDLITVAGRDALEKADLVVYAGSLVSEEMLRWCQPNCRTISSAGLNLDEIVQTLAEAYGKGQRVVRLQTGDISLYGALPEQLAELARLGIPWRIIPGVTAAFGAAATLGLSYTLPESCQSLIFTRISGRTPMPEGENLASLAAHGCSLAIYLSAALGEEVSRTLSKAYGPDSPIAVVQRATWPDEGILMTTAGNLAGDLAKVGIKRQALILAGPAVAAMQADYSKGRKSKLYDKAFSHGWRKDASGEQDK